MIKRLNMTPEPISDSVTFQIERTHRYVPVIEDTIAQRLLEKASAYDVLSAGLQNALLAYGFAYAIQNGRAYLKRDGMNLHPDHGFHSAEDMLLAAMESIATDPKKRED